MTAEVTRIGSVLGMFSFYGGYRMPKFLRLSTPEPVFLPFYIESEYIAQRLALVGDAWQ